MWVEEQGRLPNRYEIFEEAFTSIDQGRVGEGVERAAKADFVAGEGLVVISLWRGAG